MAFCAASSFTSQKQRHGGTARVRSAPGEGTEVSLSMPRPQPGAAAPEEEDA